MDGKSIEQLEIPEDETDENISNLVKKIHKISPIFYDARIDDREYNRVLTYSLSLDEAYRRLLRESETAEALEYCDKLYNLSQRHPQYFQKENELSFIDYDINKYLESDELKTLISKTLETHEYDK